MNNEPIIDQLRNCEVFLVDFANQHQWNPDPYDIIFNNERYHVGYDEENDRPMYCCMEDLVAYDDDVRSYIVRYGKYSPIRIEFLNPAIRPFIVWGVLCTNIFPVETDPCINYEDDNAKKLAKWLQGYVNCELGQLVKVSQDSYLSKLNDWFYGKIGIVKGVFLATVTDDDGHAYSLLCAQLSGLPQWSAYASQSIDGVECKNVLVPLHFLDPVRAEKKPVDCAGRTCQHCKYWDDTKKGAFDPNAGKCTYYSPFLTNDNFAQYRKQDDYCNAWEAKDET